MTVLTGQERATGDTHRRRSGARRIGVVVGLAAAAAAIVTTNGSDPVSAPDGSPSGISLSMSVDPGQPVPVELITEEAAHTLYENGFRGQGVDVALVDSGVAPVAGLDQQDKILYGPDLSNEGGQDNLANLDTYGHGTHLAGIIAGDDGADVVGVAPESRVVSVKVAGATGETDIAQVIAGIDWVVEHKNDNGLNIRVLNLSLGVEGLMTNQGDPLSAAVERAWDAGIVVVAAAGNRGNDSPGIDSPALSPYVLAVGGTESYESSGEEDVVAPWSSGGNGYRTPDVVAPGRSIMSFRVPGSMLDQMHPEAVVGDHYFRGSGTSQSAAVVSGFTAALLSADPTMTPDQVKFLYKLFADDVANGNRLDGRGRIDVEQMSKNLRYKWKARPQSHSKAIPNSACAAETMPTLVVDSAIPVVTAQPIDVDVPVLTAQPIDGTLPVLTAQPMEATLSSATDAQPVDTVPLDAVPVETVPVDADQVASAPTETQTAGSPATGDAPIDEVVPCGDAWSGGSWSGATWSGGVWSGATWSGATWSGATWSGATWSGATWSGATWSGATWSGKLWSSTSLSGSTWS